MYHYVYQFYKPEYRESIDLTLDSQAINVGIEGVFENVANITVRRDQFEFDLPENASNGKLRQMGKKIIKDSNRLGGLVKTHQYVNQDETPGESVKLFVRKMD